MRTAGLSDGRYEFGGQTMTFKNLVTLTEAGNLTGSAATPLYCVKQVIKFGTTEEDAVKVATENPVQLMRPKKLSKIGCGFNYHR